MKFKSYDKFNSIFFNQSGFHFGNNKIILSKIGKIRDYNAARNILIMAFEVGREPASKLIENSPSA